MNAIWERGSSKCIWCNPLSCRSEQNCYIQNHSNFVDGFDDIMEIIEEQCKTEHICSRATCSHWQPCCCCFDLDAVALHISFHVRRHKAHSVSSISESHEQASSQSRIVFAADMRFETSLDLHRHHSWRPTYLEEKLKQSPACHESPYVSSLCYALVLIFQMLGASLLILGGSPTLDDACKFFNFACAPPSLWSQQHRIFFCWFTPKLDQCHMAMF